MTEPDVYKLLTEIFHDVFMRDDIVLSAATTAADVDGWDSFKQIEIIVSLQESLGIKFSSKELDHLHCVGDLARLVAEKAG